MIAIIIGIVSNIIFLMLAIIVEDKRTSVDQIFGSMKTRRWFLSGSGAVFWLLALIAAQLFLAEL